MNKLTRKILEVIVTDDSMWEWKKIRAGRKLIPIRGKPKIGEIEDLYYKAWGDMITDNVVFPMFDRAYKLYDLICRGAFGAEVKKDNFLHYHFIYESIVDEYGTPGELMEINCASCQWDIQERLTNFRYWEWHRSKHGGRTHCYLDRYLQRHEDMQQETITEEMIMEVASPAKGEQIKLF